MMLVVGTAFLLDQTAYAGDFVHDLCSLPSGTHLVVDYDADANGNGSSASPFNTLTDCTAIVRPGEACLVKSSAPITDCGENCKPNSGTGNDVDQRVTIAGYPGTTPEFHQNGNRVLSASDRDYLTFCGLKLVGAFYIHSSDGVILEHSDLSQGGYKNDGNFSAIMINGIGGQDVNDFVIRDNVIHDIADAGSGAKCISGFNPTRLLIEHNWFFNCRSAIYFEKESAQDTIFRHNRVTASPGHAIKLDIGNQRGDKDYWARNLHIYQNVFDCSNNPGDQAISHRKGAENLLVESNTFHKCICWGDKQAQDISAGDLGSVFNNICHFDGEAVNVEVSATTPTAMDWNLYAPGAVFDWPGSNHDFAGIQSMGFELNGLIAADVQFNAPAMGNFTLRGTSPARGAGCRKSSATGGNCPAEQVIDLGAFPEPGINSSVGPRNGVADPNPPDPPEAPIIL